MTLLWLSFPFVTAFSLTQWLLYRGYRDVTVHIGYPGLRSVRIFEIRFAKALNDEQYSIHAKNCSLEWSVSSLLSGQFDRVVLPDAAVALTSASRRDIPATRVGQAPADASASTNIVTVNDLVEGIPTLPFVTLQMDHMTVLREQATGPLRELTIEGTVQQHSEGVFAQFSVRGSGTQSYLLRVTDLTTQVMSIRLDRGDQTKTPIVYWRSEAVPRGTETQLKGQIEIDVDQLAPFIDVALPIGPELRQVSGKIRASWSGTASSLVSVTSIWRHPDTRIQGMMQSDIHLPEIKGVGKNLALTMTGRFSGNSTRLLWAIDAGKLGAATVDVQYVPFLRQIQQYLPTGVHALRIECRQGMTGELSWVSSPAHFLIRGPITISHGSRPFDWSGQVVVADIAGIGKTIETSSGTFNLSGRLPKALLEATHARAANMKVLGSFTIDRSRIRASIEKPTSITIDGIRHPRAEVDHLRVFLQRSMPIAFDVQSKEWDIGSSAVTIRLGEIRADHLRLSSQPVRLDLKSAGGSRLSWSVTGSVAMSSVTFLDKARVPVTDWTVHFSADPGIMKAEFQVQAHNIPVPLTVHAQYGLSIGRGALRGELGPVSFDHEAVLIRTMPFFSSYPVSLTGGKLFVRFDADWKEGPSHLIQFQGGRAEIVLQGLSGRFQEVLFHGAETTVSMAAKGFDSLSTLRPAQVTVTSINPGIEMTGLSMTVQAEWMSPAPLPVIEIRDVKVGLLGGTLTSQGVRADLNHPPHTVTFLARQLDLQQILGLEQQRGLHGSGFIDGTVPVTVNSGSVTAREAEFEARPPGGVIRYEPPDGGKTVAQANPAMKLVLQALSNFHYNVLQVGAEYTRDKNLNIKARLEGRNPDLKIAPPVHFNLTVQEHIPALIKSLRIARDIEDSVGANVERP
ncbi:exported protein of unknown function [Nitrospira sp. KM1]|nr:exported protein of unknown function [Nitrospira sp. KM1]